MGFGWVVIVLLALNWGSVRLSCREQDDGLKWQYLDGHSFGTALTFADVIDLQDPCFLSKEVIRIAKLIHALMIEDDA